MDNSRNPSVPHQGEIRIPVKGSPFQHQLAGIRFACDLFGIESGAPLSEGVIFNMEMGTGKTFTVISVAGVMYTGNLLDKMIIVAPLSILPVWKEELAKFADYDYEAVILTGTLAHKRQQIALHSRMQPPSPTTRPPLRVIIVNYESMRLLKKELLAFNAGMIVADEGHKLKNPHAEQTKAMIALGDKAQYKLVLTGTLIPNHEIDVYGPFRFANPDIFGRSFAAFRATYFWMGGYENHVPFFRKSTEPVFLRKLHSISYRVTKAECLDLPEVTDTVRTVVLEPDAAKLYRQVADESYAELAQSESSVTASNVLTRMLRLSQMAGGHITDDDGAVSRISTAKLSALEDLIDEALSGRQKIVVMARFIAELDDIEDLLRKKKIDYAVIRGGVRDRDEQVRRFQEDETCMVFLGQISTAGLGVTLTAASTMVFYSVDYSMANHEQARARIHRAGQKNACLYIYLCAEKTIDFHVLKALQDKKDVAKAFIDDYRLGLNPFQDKRDELKS